MIGNPGPKRLLLGVICLFAGSLSALHAELQVTDVTAAQSVDGEGNPGCNVNISYTLSGAENPVEVSVTATVGGRSVSAQSFSGSGYGPGITDGTWNIVWHAGADLNSEIHEDVVITVTARPSDSDIVGEWVVYYTWDGSETLNDRWTFLEDGSLNVYITGHSGTWSQYGNTVTIQFPSGTSYQGVLDSQDYMSGTMSDGATGHPGTWESWRITPDKRIDPPKKSILPRHSVHSYSEVPDGSPEKKKASAPKNTKSASPVQASAPPITLDLSGCEGITILSLEPEMEGIYLHGIDLKYRISATVDWGESTPGRVQFFVNDLLAGEVGGLGPTYDAALTIDDHFRSIFEDGGNVIRAVAVSGSKESPPEEVSTTVVPGPVALLGRLGESGFIDPTGHFYMDFSIPSEPLEKTVNIPWLGRFGSEFSLGGSFDYTITDGEWELDLYLSDQLERKKRGRRPKVRGRKQNGHIYLGNRTISADLGGFAKGTATWEDGIQLNELGGSGSVDAQFELGRYSFLDFFGPGITSVVSEFPQVSEILTPVSVIVWLKGGVSGEAVMATYPDFDLEEFEATGTLGLEATYELSHRKLSPLQVKAYMGGEVGFMFGSPGDLFKAADLKFYAGLEVEVWVFSFSNYVIFAEWNWGSGKSASSDALREYGNDSGPTPITRSPAPEKKPATKLKSLGGGEEILVTNAFANSNPAQDAFGDRRMIVYVRDNGSPEVTQCTDIGSLYFDGNSWTGLQPIAIDTRAEFAPDVAFDGDGTPVAIWQRVRDPDFVEFDVTAMASEMEIVWSKYDTVTKTWSPVETLTDNAVLDHDPRLSAAMADGRLVATWTQNGGNRIIADAENPDRVYYSVWDPATGTWSVPQAFLTDLAGVTSRDFAGAGTKAVFAWSADGDGDLADDTDSEVFYSTWEGAAWSAPQNGAPESGRDRGVSVGVTGTSQAALIWNSGDDIMVRQLDGSPAAVLYGDASSAGIQGMSVAGNPAGGGLLALTWSEMSEDGADPFYAILDLSDKSAGEPYRLCRTPELESSLDVVWTGTTELGFTYTKTEITFEERVVELSKKKTTTVSNVPTPGRIDIARRELSLQTDLALKPEGLLLEQGSGARGSVTLATDTENSTFGFPFSGYYDYSWSATIVPASEINLAGEISAIQLDVYSAPENMAMTQQRILVAHTSHEKFPNGSPPNLAAMTEVFGGTLIWNGSGWKEIVFDEPFDYNGTDNLLLYFENRDGSYESEYPRFRYSEGYDNATIFDQQDGSFPTTAGAIFDGRPNMILEFGVPAKIDVTIFNEGDLPVPAPEVTLYDGDPLSGGQVVETGMVEGTLKGRSTARISFEIPPGELNSFYVVVDPDDEISESDENNNALPFSSGADLSLHLVRREVFPDGSAKTRFRVENHSSFTSAETDFLLRLGADETGTEMAAVVVPEISVNGFYEFDVNLPPGTLTTGVTTRFWSTVLESGLGVNPNDSVVTFGLFLGVAEEKRQPPPPSVPDITSVNGDVPEARGQYRGLLRDEAGRPVGELILTVARGGRISGKAVYFSPTPVTVPIRGILDENGVLSGTIDRKGVTYPFSLQLGTTDNGVFRLSGFLENLDSGDIFDFSIEKPGYHRKTNPSPFEGRYTFLLPGNRGHGLTEPGGDGHGSLNINRDGTIRGSGILGDAQKVSFSGKVSEDGLWQCFRALYGNRGFLSGDVHFREIANFSDFDGRLEWRKNAHAKSSRYPEGFHLTDCPLLGSAFAPPYPGDRILPSLPDRPENASVTFGHGQIVQPEEQTISWESNNRIVHVPSGREKLTMKASSATGMITGSFRDPDTGVKIKFNASVHQKQGIIRGVFAGDRKRTGFVEIDSRGTPLIQITELSSGVPITNGDDTPGIADGTDFGDTGIEGGTSDRAFVIHNTGDGGLFLPETPVLSPPAPGFAIVSATRGIIPAGGSARIVIRFQPTEEGPGEADVVIPSNDAGANPFVFRISGNGIPGSTSSSTTGAPTFSGDLPDFSRIDLPSDARDYSEDFDGTYQGIIRTEAPGDPVAGFLKLKVTRAKFSGKIEFDGGRASLKGSFDTGGSYSGTVRLHTGAEFPFSLQTAETSDHQVRVLTGQLTGADQVHVFHLFRNDFHPKTNPYPEAGRFTMLIPGNEGLGSGYPHGTGFSTLSFSSKGTSKVLGVLGDGTRLSFSTFLTGENQFLYYRKMYQASAGHIAGWMTLREVDGTSDFDGKLEWIRPSHARSKQFPHGFRIRATGIGSRFTPETPVLGGTEGPATVTFFSGGLSPVPDPLSVFWQENNRVVQQLPSPAGETVKVKVNAGTGAVSGSFKRPGQSLVFQGAVFQKQDLAGGSFLIRNAKTSGGVEILPVADD